MIEVKNKKNCCGCWACWNACPKHCIEMEEDEEGFRYPKVNKDLCIECKLCEKVCPILQVKKRRQRHQQACIVQNKNPEVLRESTSGGFFTALAEAVISKGGVVFGAAFDGKGEVVHQFVRDERQLGKFRNSKYVQSIIGDSYRQAKNFLENNELVLFSGTPCQLEGLLNFLLKQYENLITVDVVCRAVPSPMVFKKYIEMQSLRNSSGIEKIIFRDKYHGYKYSTMSLKWENGIEYHEGIDTDCYLRSFFAGSSIRQSCGECKFRSRYRRTDFTMWDCFNVGDYSHKLDNDKGATRVLIHSGKAEKIMETMADKLLIEYIDADKVVEGVKELIADPNINANRQQFLSDMSSMSAEECFNKYYPITMRHRIEKTIRLVTNKLGVYGIAKRLFKAMIGNREVRR